MEQVMKRKHKKHKKHRGIGTRLSITEMAKRLGISRQGLYYKNRVGFTVYDLQKILQPDFPELKVRDIYTCPFMTPGKRLLRIGNVTLAVKQDGKVTLMKEEKAEELKQKRCVLCGVREGEETVSPKTGVGFHLTGTSCIMCEPNCWICYECCKECSEFEWCPDSHEF